MFRPMTVNTQKDRSQQYEEAKSCLTLASLRSDNGSIRLDRRRKSFCGLKLDGFFGAMQWSLRANTGLVDALWSGAMIPRAADQTDLPVIANLCVQPCFRFWKLRSPRTHFAQPACCSDFDLSVFTSTELEQSFETSKYRRTSMRIESLHPMRSSDRFTSGKFESLLIRSFEFAVEETSSCC